MAAIRLAGPDDLDVVRRCIDAAFAPYVPRIGKPPAPMLQDYAALIGKVASTSWKGQKASSACS
jgi:hypothetical protein